MKVAIIVAAGSGNRFGGQLPKQFLILNDKPVLAHSIDVFAKTGAQVIVVLSDEMRGYWEEQCRQFQVQNHQIVIGGNERYDSVKNAIAVVSSECKLIAIHDAARPAIDAEFIDRMWKAAEDKGSAIPYWPIADSLRMNQNGEWKIIDRNLVRSIQTPQCFQWNLIQHAYESEYLPIFTDDASVVELVKPGSLHFELGLAENIKITQSFDMDVMKAILSNRKF
jgi:2-C-methyl-D-erythritol 4-phosphate cytidylyltransferase